MQTLEFTMAVAGNKDTWVPACGGTEQPFRARSGTRLLYCYNPQRHQHAYLNVDCDVIISDEEANLHLGR
jgi:hypothetical protein